MQPYGAFFGVTLINLTPCQADINQRLMLISLAGNVNVIGNVNG
jgi:hypothetical protein